MKIPTKFKLMGQTFNVEYNKDLINERDLVGVAKLRLNKIELQPNVGGIPITDEQLGHTFCHELVHCILGVLGEKELKENEKFVDTFGGLLFQMLETSEYEDTL